MERTKRSIQTFRFGDRAGKRMASRPALVIGESEPPFPDLFRQDAVFFPEVVARDLLMAVDPAGQKRAQDLPGLENVGHERSAGDSERSSQLLAMAGKL